MDWVGKDTATGVKERLGYHEPPATFLLYVVTLVEIKNSLFNLLWAQS